MASMWQKVIVLLAWAVMHLAFGDRIRITPVEQVIKLLTDMKAEVAKTGAAEGKTYAQFACFCQDATMETSKSIMKEKDNVHTFAAGFEEKSAEVTTKQNELKKEIDKKVRLEGELKDTKSSLAKGTADYDEKDADLSKAISSLERAIKTLESSQPSAGLVSIGQSIKKSLALAEALKLVDEGPTWSSVTALLQQGSGVDPSDPEYKFHSQGIIDILKKLEAEFTGKKADADSEWAKTKSNLENTIDSLTKELELNGKIRDSLKIDIDNKIFEAAHLRAQLLVASAQLQDDESYMRKTTEMCEARAKDWDQRTQMRAGELDALAKALEIMTDRVKAADESANKRALMLVQGRVQLPAQKSSNHSSVQPDNASVRAYASNVTVANATPKQDIAIKNKLVSFLQQHAIKTTGKGRTELALDVLRKESSRIHSVALSMLVMHVAADPFAKVKTMIQNLIERLIEEATQEATKKGFCDKALADAEQERDFQFAEVKKLSASVQTLEAKKGALELEIDDLKDSVASLDSALTEAVKVRADDKQDNLGTIKTAKEGLKAVQEAITVLQDFYRQAARAKVLLQKRDAPVPGFSGAYKGNQAGSKGVIGLLEVIKSDFERTIKTTSQAEEEDSTEHAEFAADTSSQISRKSLKKQLDDEDLAKTNDNLASDKADMKSHMDLVDQALKELQKHQHMCVDHGQTYEERKKKREEEMAALKKALCQLDTNGVEKSCGLSE